LNTKKWEMLLTAEEIAKVTFVKGSVDSDEFVESLVTLSPDAVIHLAGLQVPTCRENPVLGAKVNVIGTLNIFEAAKKLAKLGRAPVRIVYASSAAIFGADADYGEQAVGDMSVPKPSSHYGAYKLCTEHAAKAYWIANQIPSVGLRPLTVYGPGRDLGLTSFPTRAIAAAIKGQKFDISFSGNTVYTYVEEVRGGAETLFGGTYFF
jgi:nucleoside-diphosphate-sugar epimerase